MIELDGPLTNLVIHIVLKALEDYYAYIELREGGTADSDMPLEVYFSYTSARDYFFGCEFDTLYELHLDYLGWDTELYGRITPEKWLTVIAENYNSIADARPNLGLSTRLIPKDSALWHRLRERRQR